MSKARDLGNLGTNTGNLSTDAEVVAAIASKADANNPVFTGKMNIPSGNTASRPASPSVGTMYYNTQIKSLEVYDGIGWASKEFASPSTVTGGTLTSDATYYYRTFTSSGTLTIANSPLTCDYLIVAGGGGAGGAGGVNSGTGGGGAGGYISGFTTLAAQSYTITVGSGGSGGPALDKTSVNQIFSTTGANSSLGSVGTSIGGGASPNSNSTYNGSARNGGSGAGGTGNPDQASGQIGFPGTGTSGQGSNGGNSWYGSGGSFYSGGGGGGAGAAGGNASSTSAIAGNGGIGLQWNNGSYYAGGGGGGAYNSGTFSSGGLGGGGNGGGNGTTAGSNGTANTGGGGGGTGGGASAPQNAQLGGNGGSGVVIIRYPKSSAV